MDFGRAETLRYGLKLRLKLTALSLFICSAASFHAQGRTLSDRWLAVLKVNTILDFEQRAEKLQQLATCLRDKEACQDVEFHLGISDGTLVESGFSQQEVLEILAQEWAGYREAIALRAAKAFEIYGSRGLILKATEFSAAIIFKAGRPKACSEPVKRKEECEDYKERQRILAKVANDNSGMKKARAFLPDETKALELRMEIYDARVKSLSAAYPYFLYLSKREFTQDELRKAVDKVLEACLESRDMVQSYRGDERLKLLGFPAAVQESLAGATESEIQEIESALEEIRGEIGFRTRVKEFVTNWPVMAALGCYTGTILIRPLYFLQFVCGSWSAGVLGVYLYEATMVAKGTGTLYRTGLLGDEQLTEDKAYLYAIVLSAGMFVQMSGPSLRGQARAFFGRSRELALRTGFEQVKGSKDLLLNPVFVRELTVRVKRQLLYNLNKSGIHLGADRSAAMPKWEALISRVVEKAIDNFNWKLYAASVGFSDFVNYIYDTMVMVDPELVSSL